MARIEVSINGRAYSVACRDGDEPRVRDLAAGLDARVQRLAQTGSASEAHLLVLTGLMMADELEEARAQVAASADGAGSADGAASGDGAEDEALLVAAVHHLVERIDDVAARLEET